MAINHLCLRILYACESCMLANLVCLHPHFFPSTLRCCHCITYLVFHSVVFPRLSPVSHFIRFFSYFYAWLMFRTGHLQAARSCISLPDDPFSLSSPAHIHICFSLPFLLFIGPSITITFLLTYFCSLLRSHYMSVQL